VAPSGLAEVIELSNFMHSEIIPSLANWMTNHPQKGHS